MLAVETVFWLKLLAARVVFRSTNRGVTRLDPSGGGPKHLRPGFRDFRSYGGYRFSDQ
jgi:hypothetical protein